jgi:hypothetical protein
LLLFKFLISKRDFMKELNLLLIRIICIIIWFVFIVNLVITLFNGNLWFPYFEISWTIPIQWLTSISFFILFWIHFQLRLSLSCLFRQILLMIIDSHLKMILFNNQWLNNVLKFIYLHLRFIFSLKCLLRTLNVLCSIDNFRWFCIC